MKKIGNFIVNHSVLIIIISLLLLAKSSKKIKFSDLKEWKYENWIKKCFKEL